MTRRRLLVCLTISSLLSAWNATGQAAEDRPNVVLILADDLGFGELSCYGHPRFKTPHLDRMAAEGARFTQFNTPMPFCAPTRASLLTGRYPFRNGLTGNPTPDASPEADALALSMDETLLPQLLKQAGYATGMVGKWHLGHRHSEYLPTHRGFDDYLGILYSNDMRPVELIDGEKVVEYPVVQATITKRYTERALQFIEKNQKQPFFLYFAHAMPHKPLACSEEFTKKSGAGLYGDVLAELDDSVGQVMAKLAELGLDERTLVIFTSDNGPWYGGSTGGLRGMKGTSWEGGFRVPCLMRWPGRIAGGRESQAPALMMDLFATVLEAVGVAAPAGRVIDGKSLLPVVEGKAQKVHEYVLGHQGEKVATVRDERWKLHVLGAKERRDAVGSKPWVDPRGPDGVTILAPCDQYSPADYPGVRGGDETVPGSLFDLSADPAEQRDVSGQHPEVVARLKAAFHEALEGAAKTTTGGVSE